MNRVLAVRRLLGKLNAKTYLEIGVAGGFTFTRVHTPRKIGVDTIPASKEVTRILSDNVKYFQMTSDSFFENEAEKLFKDEKIDVVLIDGLHEYKQVLKDVSNCLPYLKEKGVIVIHDCNPTTEKMQMVPRSQNEWTGDVWKAIVHLRQSRDDLHIFVLNCDYGLGIITRGKPESKLDLSLEEVEKISYRELESNREGLTNLKDASYFSEFLERASKN